MNVHALNSKFAHKGNIFFNKKGDHIIAKIDNKFASCAVSLYGAHVLSYEPQGEENVLWMSKKSFFESGKPIRGGIPVCFPWFGPHKTEKNFPQHGFARTSQWDVENVSSLADGTTQLILKLSQSENSIKFWPHKFESILVITIGEKLEVALEVINTDNHNFEYTDALHSYFNISNPENIIIKGLKGAEYFDGLSGDSRLVQSEELLRIIKEENRRYINHANTCIINDPSKKRQIIVEKENSNTTIVWNPWKETSKGFNDMAEDGFKTMVCIEAANAYNDVVSLKPGEKFKMSTRISIKAL